MSQYVCPYCTGIVSAPVYAMPFIEPTPIKVCRICGNLATWVPAYQKWYCYLCHKYV